MSNLLSIFNNRRVGRGGEGISPTAEFIFTGKQPMS
jgi:hypothetical protein